MATVPRQEESKFRQHHVAAGSHREVPFNKACCPRWSRRGSRFLRSPLHELFKLLANGENALPRNFQMHYPAAFVH